MCSSALPNHARLGAHSPLPVLHAALGVRITGVDDATYSQTGESYSAICLPNANTHTERVLQEDNTDLVNALSF